MVCACRLSFYLFCELAARGLLSLTLQKMLVNEERQFQLQVDVKFLSAIEMEKNDPNRVVSILALQCSVPWTEAENTHAGVWNLGKERKTVLIAF